MTVKDVYTGSSEVAGAAESVVEIIDRFKPDASNHEVHVFQPGDGITSYRGSGLDDHRAGSCDLRPTADLGP